MSIKHCLLYTILLLTGQSYTNVKQIPFGKIDVLDKQILEEEWKNSLIIPLHDSLNLMLLNNEESLFLSIDYLENDSAEYRWVELFFEFENTMYRLHASGQLGEQTFNGVEWNEEWNWGNNEKWTATKFGLNNPNNRGYEFSISKDLIGQHKVKLMVTAYEVIKTADFSKEPIATNFPKNANKKDPTTWIAFNF